MVLKAGLHEQLCEKRESSSVETCFSFGVKNEIQQFAWANNGIAEESFEGVPAC